MFARATANSQNFSARGIGWLRAWIERKRKDMARREVIAKHAKPVVAAAKACRAPAAQRCAPPARPFDVAQGRPGRSIESEPASPSPRQSPPVVARKRAEAAPSSEERRVGTECRS